MVVVVFLPKAVRGGPGAARLDVAWRNKVFAAWLAQQPEDISSEAKVAKLKALSQQWRDMTAESRVDACANLNISAVSVRDEGLVGDPMPDDQAVDRDRHSDPLGIWLLSIPSLSRGVAYVLRQRVTRCGCGQSHAADQAAEKTQHVGVGVWLNSIS